MEGKFKVEIDRRQIVDTINEHIMGVVRQQLEASKGNIQKSISEYFQKSILSWKEEDNAFDRALDYTVDIAVRESVQSAMEEIGFKEIVAAKTKEILTDSSFIHQLAEAKVRSSLGLH